jgi:DNA-binding transcriptional regulator GbsR (MarR family)
MSNNFKQKFRNIEKKLLDYALEIGQRRSSEKITIINFYLFMYESLTQKELKKLTNFSIGTISTHLNAMISLGLIEKNLIPGTHQYTYSFILKPKAYASSGIDIALNAKKEAEQFFQGIKAKLDELKVNKGAKFLKGRIEEFIDYLTMIQIIFSPFLKLKKQERL